MMPIDGIINGTNGIINQNQGEESMNAVIKAPLTVDTIANVTEDSYYTSIRILAGALLVFALAYFAGGWRLL